MFEEHEQKPNSQQSSQSAEQEPSDIFRDVAQSADQEFEETPSQDTSYEQLPRQGNPHIILYIIIAILSVLVLALTVALIFVKLNPQNQEFIAPLQPQSTIPLSTPKIQMPLSTPYQSLVPLGTPKQTLVPTQTPTPTFTPQQSTPPPSGGIDSDTDKDGLSNSEEEKLGTRIDIIDSDGDGLSDREEIKVYKTNPLTNDSDNDTYKDGEEIKNGYNPNGPGKLIQAPQ